MRNYSLFCFFVFLIVFGNCCAQNPKENQGLSEAADPQKKNPKNLPKEIDKAAQGIQWKTIEVLDSTIAYSKIAQLGKVSVFLLSTPWCGPCKKLKAELEGHGNWGNQVDFYYVNMCHEYPKKNFNDLKKTDAYFFARYFDRLKEWPRVVITSPSGSIIKSFGHEDLYQECLKKKTYDLFFESETPTSLRDIDQLKEDLVNNCSQVSVYDKTIEILERLLKFNHKFHLDRVVTTYSKKKT